jgi:hypothetical protein
MEHRVATVERWTFLVIAAPDGAPAALRVLLRAGADEASWPRLQVALDGTMVPVDDVDKDYEAPEWKALELFLEGGGTAEQWASLKDRLRAGGPA